MDYGDIIRIDGHRYIVLPYAPHKGRFKFDMGRASANRIALYPLFHSTWLMYWMDNSYTYPVVGRISKLELALYENP